MTDKKRKNAGIVYSTGQGRMCPSCAKPFDECVCDRVETRRKGDGIVRVRRERKGKRGKTVTVITGAPLDDAGLRELASRLKRLLGAGGAVRDGVIEIQGDRVEQILAELTVCGYKGKRAGG